jgi:hypothetical protein
MNSRATFRELLQWGTEEPKRELFLKIIEEGVCPTQFPDFKQEDCRPKKPQETGNACVLCWQAALYDKKIDGHIPGNSEDV